VVVIPAAAQTTVAGLVQSVAGNDAVVASDSGAVRVHADEKTVVWKGSLHHDLTAIHAGDVIRTRCRRDSFGRLTASEIQARVRFTGRVREIAATRIDVDGSETPYSVADISPATRYAISPHRIAVDDEVEIVGWDVRNGRVEAERISVYNLDAPVSRSE